VANRDYYEILGVSRKATSREIRRAFRALARNYHLDLHPADDSAPAKFREVHEAYEVLGNSRKRKAYDYYGPDFGQRIPCAPPGASRPRGSTDATASADSGRRAYRSARTTDTPRWGGIRSGVRSYHPALLGRLIVVGSIFFAGAWVYLAIPDAGVREFKQAREALRHASSWKSEVDNMTPAAQSEFLDEVGCPSSERMTHHIRATIAGTAHEQTVRTLIVDHKEYLYNDSQKRWELQHFLAHDPSSICARISRGEDAGSLPPFGKWLREAFIEKIEKGAIHQTPDGECREWKIVTPGGPPQNDFICLGVKDHLPRIWGPSLNPQAIRYYDWNAPIQPVPAEIANATFPKSAPSNSASPDSVSQ
jgi:hypothetical protein